MKWLLIFATVFLFTASLTIGGIAYYNFIHRDNFFPGLTILDQKLDGLTKTEARVWLQKLVDDYLEEGLIYFYNDHSTSIDLIAQATDPDLSGRLIDFKIVETVDRAMATGRNNTSPLLNALALIKIRLWGYQQPLLFELNEAELKEIISQNYQDEIRPATEARPIIATDGQITIGPDQAGQRLDFDKILEKTKQHLSRLITEPIIINFQTDQPLVKKEEITQETKKKIIDFIKAGQTLTLTYQKTSWLIDSDVYQNWLGFAKNGQKIELTFTASSTSEYIAEKIAPQVETATKNAKFEITNGRVTEFQSSQDGRKINYRQTLANLNREIFNNNNFQAELAVTVMPATITNGLVNDLGIVELLGEGRSNFAGSPPNRRHNIKVGADSLNGLLIAPGQEFSLIKALGEINAEAGYLQELVIKGDRTIPEYGGGLCQIGTTIFRATLGSGLPVISRRNHSYRVSYYEPAGTDATIYDPWPDYKFKNDLDSHVLIQTRIEGDELIFEFWGTKDGRKTEQTEPTIYNIVPPGETQYIETDELPPGEEKCVETAHSGADAYFDYTVTYPDGEIKEKRFESHYIPWPKKCLIGKKLVEETATSTKKLIND